MKNAVGKWTNCSRNHYYDRRPAGNLQAAEYLSTLTATKQREREKNVRMRGNQARPSLRRLLNGVLFLAGFVALLGCGDGKIARYPVSGTVLVDGKPAEGVVVVLCPISGPPEFQRERPYGTTDAVGKFTMMTFGSDDGAPAGEYKVLAQWPKGDRDAFRGRYFNLENATLTATVEEGPTELPPFELKSR